MRDLFFIVCCWQELRAFKIKLSSKIFWYCHYRFFLSLTKFGQIFWINITTNERARSQKVKEAGDKFGSLKILTVFRLALHEVNWKPVYFTNFWGIKSRIYDACEISNCRDKNIFRGYLDTSTNIGFLSFLLQKYFMWREVMRQKSKMNAILDTMGKL